MLGSDSRDLVAQLEENLEIERLEDRLEMAQICTCTFCRCGG